MWLWLVLRWTAEADSAAIPLHNLQLENKAGEAKGWEKKKQNLSVNIQDGQEDDRLALPPILCKGVEPATLLSSSSSHTLWVQNHKKGHML